MALRAARMGLESPCARIGPGRGRRGAGSEQRRRELRFQARAQRWTRRERLSQRPVRHGLRSYRRAALLWHAPGLVHGTSFSNSSCGSRSLGFGWRFVSCEANLDLFSLNANVKPVPADNDDFRSSNRDAKLNNFRLRTSERDTVSRQESATEEVACGSDRCHGAADCASACIVTGLDGASVQAIRDAFCGDRGRAV